MFDVIIRDADVVDGTGAGPRRADVGISGSVITAIEPLPPGAVSRYTVDGGGRLLCPGFIDIHTHSDLTLIEDGRGESKLRQGVTTEVVGNCSFSAFPIEPSRRDLHADHLARATAAIVPWWSDLDGYAAALEDEGLALNVIPLVGHGTLRIAAMGVDSRPATKAELGRMERDLLEALDQGAYGMSTGLTHVPSAYGDVEEVATLVAALARRGALYATHARAATDERVSVAEAIDVGRRTGASVEFSHLAINRPERWGHADELLALFDDARGDGVDVSFDVYPYDASSSSLTQYLPPWVQAGGTAELRRRLADPPTRALARRDMEAGWFEGIPWLWDRFVVSACHDHGLVGRTLADISVAAGCPPDDLTLRLCEEYGNELQVVLFYRTEADVARFVAHPLSVIGSDGNAIAMDQPHDRPHPRTFGTFPRVLARYCRDRQLLEIGDAVRKMTAEPARRLGLPDRGVLAVGKVADCVLVDLAVVGDRADFTSRAEPPTGIDLVMVGGEVVLDGGRIGTARPGRVLRRGG